MLNPVKRTDLTPDDLEILELKKAIAIAQAKLLCEAHDAGQLRQWLDRLKGNIDNGQYVSYSKHPQQKAEVTDE